MLVTVIIEPDEPDCRGILKFVEAENERSACDKIIEYANFLGSVCGNKLVYKVAEEDACFYCEAKEDDTEDWGWHTIALVPKHVASDEIGVVGSLFRTELFDFNPSWMKLWENRNG